MKKLFIPDYQALTLKELGFDEPCLGYWNIDPYLPKPTFNLVKPFEHEWCLPAPLYQQAINFLYICSNKQINIELKGSDTYEERIRKIEQGCKDLWNLQNNKSNQ